MINETEAERLAERVRRLDSEQVFGKPAQPIGRELWLKTRALDLSLSIHLHITFGFTGPEYHDEIQNWIDELQDLWQLIER